MAAPICTECPPPAQLRRLIDGALPSEETSSVTVHLDCCEDCQRTIEQIAAGGSGLLDFMGRRDDDGPKQTSAYWPALRKLEREVSSAAHASLGVTRAQDELGTDSELPLDFLDPPEQPGTLGKIGRFHVVEMVGKGGMGMVLRALDVCLQRQVALKVLDPQYVRNDLARNRFIREARAAASIAHDNVVAIHHVEHHRENIPFLVMRLVTGESLQDRLDRQGGPLPIREVLEIGRQTAAGLAAAHEQSLIHRDIKPANILLEAGTGKVLLTDFGLARAVEDVKLTQTGFVAGTPLYMSPEQARGAALDHRSDLFSLGSVLYAMCTGNPPFQGSSPFGVLREVTEGRHRPVRDINPNVPEDLTTIIEHLLAKKPDDRLQSAAQVADLLGQVLARLPMDPHISPMTKKPTRILPRPRGSWFVRNGHLLAAAILGLNGLLLISEAGKLTQWTRIGQRGAPAMVPAPIVHNDDGPTPRLTLDAGTGPIWSVAFSPDGETVAMAIDDGSVRLWNSITGQLKSRIPAHKRPVWSVAYNSAGTRIATASDDGYVRLWDTANNRQINEVQMTGGSPRAVAFSRDGSRLAVGTRGGDVRVYDAETFKLQIVTAGHTDGVVMSVAFSFDGQRVASGSGDKTVKIWDVSDEEGKEVATLSGHAGGVYAVAFHPTKRIVASGGWDRTIRLFDLDTAKEIRKLEGHEEDVWAIAFCCDGNILASGSEDHTARIWDVETGKQQLIVKGHAGALYGIAISPVPKTLATAGRDGTVKLWSPKE